MSNLKFVSLAIPCIGFMLMSSPAYTDTLAGAIKEGQTMIDLRYRFENVDDDAFSEEADASTFRTRFGYETGHFYGFSALLEFSDTTVVGDEDDFNTTLNNEPSTAIVGDPDGTELNRAQISYHGFADTTINLGRQTLVLDNERFVTNGNFRQKQQTFDQVHLVSHILPKTTINYAYQYWVQNNLSADDSAGEFDVNNHIVNVAFDPIEELRVVGYAYLLDFDDVAANSLDTYGIHIEGGVDINDSLRFIYQADYATQSDASNNPSDLSVDYFIIEPGFTYAGFTAKFGYQEFDTDNMGTVSFQTPIGDAHPYSGFADVFAATPVTGLEEFYGKLQYTHKFENSSNLDSLSLYAAYHTFEPESGGGADFGEEVDLGIFLNFMKHYSASVEYANFSDDDGAAGLEDVEKLWFTIGANFDF